MGVVRAALIDKGVVDNVILIDSENNTFIPPDEQQLVVIDRPVNIGDFYDGSRFFKQIRLQDEKLNDTTVITATVDEDTPDSTVIFSVDEVKIAEIPIEQGKAVIELLFELPGTYMVKAESEHHGFATLEVVVEC